MLVRTMCSPQVNAIWEHCAMRAMHIPQNQVWMLLSERARPSSNCLPAKIHNNPKSCPLRSSRRSADHRKGAQHKPGCNNTSHQSMAFTRMNQFTWAMEFRIDTHLSWTFANLHIHKNNLRNVTHWSGTFRNETFSATIHNSRYTQPCATFVNTQNRRRDLKIRKPLTTNNRNTTMRNRGIHTNDTRRKHTRH